MLKPCPRCLSGEIPEGEALEKLIRERIALLPEEERASDEKTQARLEICRACAFLNSGTCGKCGCYVELRAAKERQSCPDIPKRW